MKTVFTINKTSKNYPLFRAMATITANTPEKEARRFRLDCINIQTTTDPQNNRDNVLGATATDGRTLFDCILYPDSEIMDYDDRKEVGSDRLLDGLYKILSNTAASVVIERLTGDKAEQAKFPDTIPNILQQFAGLPYANILAESPGLLAAGLNWLSGRDFVLVHKVCPAGTLEAAWGGTNEKEVTIYNAAMGVNVERLDWFDQLCKTNKSKVVQSWSLEIQRCYDFDKDPDEQAAKFRIVGHEATGVPGFWQAVVMAFRFNNAIRSNYENKGVDVK